MEGHLVFCAWDAPESFGCIDPDERHTDPPGRDGSRRPHLAGCGLVAHATVRALGERGGATPPLTNGLEDPRPNELSHPRY